MRPPPLRQAIRTFQTIPSRETCLVCQCACTRIFPSRLPFIQRRGNARQSPTIWRRDRDKKKERESGRKPRAKRLVELDQSLLWRLMKRENNISVEHMSTMSSFVNIFAAKLVEAGTTKGKRKDTVDGVATILDAEEMRRMCSSADVSDMFVINMGIILHSSNHDDHEYLANALFRSASNAGNEWATLAVMDNVYNATRHTPSRLKERNVMDIHNTLNEIARRGKNTRAAVLAGKIAHSQGDVNTAIAMWKGSMDVAVAASEAARKTSEERRSQKQVDVLGGVNLADLSAPWVELSSVYYSRKDFANLKWAVDIGCEQDDPNSHFLAAQLEKDASTVKSGWFHHITKAASSGHVRAMHDLALWYAEFGWPFLDDEPPDYIKPTPFDRFPRESLIIPSTEQSSWQRLQSSLGFSLPADDSAVAQAFQSAAYPTTPQARFGMALEWLKVAMAFNYAPSYLATAGLLLEESLYSSAATPKEAVNLSDKRYTYASRADYGANKKIDRPAPNAEVKIPNPYYNPDEAKRLTREIFYAKAALDSYLHETRQFAYRQRSNDSDSLDTMFEEDFESDMGPNLKKWFRYPEVRELFMDDRTGRLIDRERQDARGVEMDLVAEAEALCEEQNWDIYGEDGSLMYRHGLQKR